MKFCIFRQADEEQRRSRKYFMFASDSNDYGHFSLLLHLNKNKSNKISQVHVLALFQIDFL